VHPLLVLPLPLQMLLPLLVLPLPPEFRW